MPKTKSSTKAKASKPAGKTAPVKTAKAEAPVVRTTVTRSSAASRRNYKDILASRFSRDLTLGALFAELIGSFSLVALLLSTNGNAIIAGITVLVFTIIFGKLSGAHINPIVSIALMATRQVSVVRGIAYIVVQLIGAMLALVVISQFVANAPAVPNPYTGEMTPAQIFKVEALVGDWRPFFAEFLGAIVFGLGVAAVTFQRREGLEAGYVVGGALLLGLLLATQGSSAILNPAAALSLDAYQMKDGNMWPIAVYAIAPALGAVAGAWLYRVLQWDSQPPKEEIK